MEKGNSDQLKRRARLIRYLKAATPSPANKGSSREFHNYTHAGKKLRVLPNCIVRHLGTSIYLECTETARPVSFAGT